MSCAKRKLERDPEYDDAEAPQEIKKWKQIEENARSQAAERIVAIVETEFGKELKRKEEELLEIDTRLQEGYRILPLLRYAVVASYYGQKVSQVPGRSLDSQTQQQNVHPAIKKFFKVKTDKETEPCFEVPSEYQSLISKSDGKVPRYIPPKSTKPSICSPTRGTNSKTKRRIVIGNVSKWVPLDARDETNSQTTHKWMMYVRGPLESPDVSSFIKRVRFFLHPSYHPNDVVDVSDPPFHLTRRGWGEFPVRVQLHFCNSLNKPVDVIHHLRLDRTYTGLQNLGAETIVDLWLHAKSAVAVEKEIESKSEPKQDLNSLSLTEADERSESEKCTDTSLRTVTEIPQDHDYLGFKCEPNPVPPSPTSDKDNPVAKTEKLTDIMIDEQTDKPTDRPPEKPTVKLTDLTIDNPTDKLTDMTIDKLTDKLTDKPIKCVISSSQETCQQNVTRILCKQTLTNTSPVKGKTEVPFVKCAGLDGKTYFIPLNVLKMRTNSVGLPKIQKTVEGSNKSLSATQDGLLSATPKPTAIVMPTISVQHPKEVNSSVVIPKIISPIKGVVKDVINSSTGVAPSATSSNNKVLLMLKNGRLFVINNQSNKTITSSLQNSSQKLSVLSAPRPGVSLLKKKQGQETVTPSTVTVPPVLGQSILKKKVQDNGPNPKLLQYREELRNLEQAPSTSFKNLDAALRYLLLRLPIVTTLAAESDYRVVHPYSTTSVSEFLSWNIGKQRASEWLRARLIRKILAAQGFAKAELRSTKQIVLWARKYAYTPLPSGYLQKGSKTVVTKEETFPSTYSEAVDIVESLEASATSLSDCEVEIDILNIDEQDKKSQVKENLEEKSKTETSITMPIESYLQNLADHVRETTREIGISLQDETIETGIKYPTVKRILVECFQLLAKDLLRKAHSHACDRENAEVSRSAKEITLADVYNTLVNEPEFDIFTNKGLGSQIADNC